MSFMVKGGPRISVRVSRKAGGLRLRRGGSLVEITMSAMMLLMVTGAMVGFVNCHAVGWRDAMSTSSSTQAARRGILQMATTIRSARSVVAEGSGATRITVRLPAYDTSVKLTVPLQDGDVVSFYLSNINGSPGASGNILWRSVNGVPDVTWSRRGGAGRVLVDPDGLQFSYNPDNAPSEETSSVVVTVSATSDLKSKTSMFSTSQECVLRNRGL